MVPIHQNTVKRKNNYLDPCPIPHFEIYLILIHNLKLAFILLKVKSFESRLKPKFKPINLISDYTS